MMSTNSAVAEIKALIDKLAAEYVWDDAYQFLEEIEDHCQLRMEEMEEEA